MIYRASVSRKTGRKYLFYTQSISTVLKTPKYLIYIASDSGPSVAPCLNQIWADMRLYACCSFSTVCLSLKTCELKRQPISPPHSHHIPLGRLWDDCSIPSHSKYCIDHKVHSGFSQYRRTQTSFLANQ